MLLPDIAPAVLHWHARHGRHDLPWQGTTDPYRVWLSEIMLQQTQVATVQRYWPRFVAAFPDVESLAAAPEDAVLALWSGLGYYARARNLHRCARAVLQRPGAQFPRRAAELAQLPGIGRSTAAAIAAICHGERVAILDANVRRVLSRVLAFGADLSRAAAQHQLWQWAEALCPRENLTRTMPAYTQGMMDLGAMLCLPRRPQCSACPLRTCCRAAHSGEPENWPQRTRRSARTRLDWWLLLRLRPGPPIQVWLQRRPGSGIWAGLHAPPAFASRAALEQGTRAARIQPLAARMHILTHRELHLHPVLVEDATPPENAAGRWVDVHHPGDVGLPAPVRSLLEEIATLKEPPNNPVTPLAQAEPEPPCQLGSAE